MQLIETAQLPEEGAEFADLWVNGQRIEADRVLQEMQYHPGDSMESSRLQAASSLVVRELLRQRAAAVGLLDLTAEDDQEAESFAHLLEQEVPGVKADQESCRCYYEANPDRFKTPVLIACSHILLAAAPDDLEQRAACRAAAQELIKTLQQHPKQFAELARTRSACPSKELGGEMGQIQKGQTVPEFERQLLRLDKGLSAQPLESRYGYHVVRVDQKEEGQQLPFPAVEAKIRRYLQERSYRKAVSQYISLLLADAVIEGVDMTAADSLLLQ